MRRDGTRTSQRSEPGAPASGRPPFGCFVDMVEAASCDGGDAPTEEAFADSERQLLVVLATEAWTRIRHDPSMITDASEAEAIVRRLSGTDTVLIARRAYPSTVDDAEVVRIARRLVEHARSPVQDGYMQVRKGDLEALVDALRADSRSRGGGPNRQVPGAGPADERSA